MGRDDEDREERLLRKAKEYVRQQQGGTGKRRRRDDEERSMHRHKKEERDHKDDKKRRRNDRSRDDDNDSSSRDRRRRKDSRRHDRRKRKKRDDDQDRKSSRKHHREDDSGRGRKRDHGDKKRKKRDKRETIHKSSKVNKSSLVDLGEVFGKPPAQLLDTEKDYFAFHKELWVYVYREEGVTFNDLSSEEARKAFSRFVNRYNQGKLERAYYDGLPPDALEEIKTTKYNWSLKISDGDSRSLHALQEGVRKQTEYQAKEEAQFQSAGRKEDDKSFNLPDDAHGNKRGSQSAQARHHERVANRRLREHVRAAEEEFNGGRKEGRERQIEKRKDLADRIHGASRRDETAVELTDDALYGGEGEGQEGFREAVQREQVRASRRAEKRNTRVAELEQKEKDKRKAMLEQLGLSGLKPGQKITIAPRKDS